MARERRVAVDVPARRRDATVLRARDRGARVSRRRRDVRRGLERDRRGGETGEGWRGGGDGGDGGELRRRGGVRGGGAGEERGAGIRAGRGGVLDDELASVRFHARRAVVDIDADRRLAGGDGATVAVVVRVQVVREVPQREVGDENDRSSAAVIGGRAVVFAVVFNILRGERRDDVRRSDDGTVVRDAAGSSDERELRVSRGDGE